MKRNYKKIILDLSCSMDERIQAAFALENIADDDSIKALAKAMLTDPSPIVRHECAFALGETAYPELAGRYLMKAIENDKNIFVKHEALMALGTLGDISFTPFVRKFLNDENLEIRESAQICLERLK
ncbi:HEAT repeat domain-containing protein [Candidatus Woesearchaeota archaeon]|nr:HEAT repeat domain-containing protein [Candidatus Woesearchaeota archaeon]